MADLRWNITYKGKVYEFNATQDLTSGHLRQMKAWFGANYGTWSNVIQMLALGDADAWSSAIWLCLKKEGDPRPSNPTMIDFPLGQFMDDLEPLESPDDDKPEEARDPQPAPPSTPDSARTSTPSEADTSHP